MASSLLALLNRRPNTPFYYGWLVLGLAGMGAFVATAVAGVVLGGVQSYILEDTNWPRTSIGLPPVAACWMSGIFAPFAGRLADPVWPPLADARRGDCSGAVYGVHRRGAYRVAIFPCGGHRSGHQASPSSSAWCRGPWRSISSTGAAISRWPSPESIVRQRGADHPGVLHHHPVGGLAHGPSGYWGFSACSWPSPC